MCADGSAYEPRVGNASGFRCSQYGYVNRSSPGATPLVLEDVGDRVDVEDVEPPARSNIPRDDFGPATHVRQPAENAVRRVHDVERLVEHVRQPVDVRLDEPGVKPKIRGERSSESDRAR